jgi:RNase H-like domain found in reverse transcriptase
MLAVIYALREWRCYLQGEFTIVTDHEPNTYLDKSTNPHTVRRRAHWLEDMRGFQYRWCYRPGRVNVADPLSRIPSTPEHAHQCMLVALRHSVAAASEVRCGDSSSVLCCSLCCAAYTILRPRTLHTPAKGDARRQDVSGDSVEETQPRRLASPGGSDTPGSQVGSSGNHTYSAPPEETIAMTRFVLRNFASRVLVQYSSCPWVSTVSHEGMGWSTDRDGFCGQPVISWWFLLVVS